MLTFEKVEIEEDGVEGIKIDDPPQLAPCESILKEIYLAGKKIREKVNARAFGSFPPSPREYNVEVG